MTEFGHTATAGHGFRMDSWGWGPFIIHVAGKIFHFEDSARFGPSLLKKNGELRADPIPGERSPFWTAHFAWAKQGRRVQEDGKTCIWEPLKPTKYYLKGRELIIVERGDEDGDYIEVPSPNRERGE